MSAQISKYIVISALMLIVMASGATNSANAQAISTGCPIGGFAIPACPVASDQVIRDKVISRLLTLATRCQFNVQVTDGAVSITGVVNDVADIGMATFLVSGIPGVVRVTNRLALSSNALQDQEIVAAVKKALSKQLFTSRQIIVNSVDGVVKLSGMVASDWSRDMAAQVAASVTGVSAVHNNLIVRDRESGGASF